MGIRGALWLIGMIMAALLLISLMPRVVNALLITVSVCYVAAGLLEIIGAMFIAPQTRNSKLETNPMKTPLSNEATLWLMGVIIGAILIISMIPRLALALAITASVVYIAWIIIELIDALLSEPQTQTPKLETRNPKPQTRNP